jgi:hypothetical protein
MQLLRTPDSENRRSLAAVGGDSLISLTCRRLVPSALLALVVASTAHSTDSAIAQFQSLQAELRRSHANNDWHSNLASAFKQKEGAALLDFLISMKFRANSLVRGRLRLCFFLDDFQNAATTGLG